jgi:hypothetical protein
MRPDTASTPRATTANAAPTVAIGTGPSTGATALAATSVETHAVAARVDNPSSIQRSISSDMVAAATAARNTFAAPGPDGTARDPAAAASGTDARPVAALRRAMAKPPAAQVPIMAMSRWIVDCAAVPEHNASEPTTAAQTQVTSDLIEPITDDEPASATIWHESHCSNPSGGAFDGASTRTSPS